MMIIIEKASKADAMRLAEIQKASFDEESKQFNNSDIGGPPGYDSASWQEEMMGCGDYYKVHKDGAIIGGALVFRQTDGGLNLGRIFIDPKYQNQGVGMRVMNEIEAIYSGSCKWWLDTPKWSVRNHHFYTKCGFTKVGEDGDMFIFEKS